MQKIVQQIGNGGHIYLSKEMVGKKVEITLVEKTIGEIEEEALLMLKPYLKHIVGVYLYGSYARGEPTPESDIDILVVADGLKIKKRIGNYEIVCASLDKIEKTLHNNAVLILPILKESKAIINERLIDEYRDKKLTKRNTRWYIETTESSLKLVKHLIDDEDSIASIVYPLIMRLRGLHMIECLIRDKKYSVREFDKHLAGLPSGQLNRMYREYRDYKPISDNSVGYEDVKKLYAYVYGYFKRVKSLWEKLR